MGKFAKAKKVGQISEKSRAARRAASPSLDLDKSITSLKAPADGSDHNPKVLGASPAGIHKKKNQKRVTRAQRVRQEKGMERAEANMDILHTKRVKSLVKEKRTKDRAGEWDELNKKFIAEDPLKANAFSAIASEWTDDEDMSENDAPAALKKANKQTISAQNVSPFETAPVKETSPVPAAAAATVDDIDDVL